jgi:hypothetical protein
MTELQQTIAMIGMEQWLVGVTAFRKLNIKQININRPLYFLSTDI